MSIAIAVPRHGYQILVGIRLASGKGSSRSALVAGVKDAVHLSYLSIMRRGTTVYRIYVTNSMISDAIRF